MYEQNVYLQDRIGSLTLSQIQHPTRTRCFRLFKAPRVIVPRQNIGVLQSTSTWGFRVTAWVISWTFHNEAECVLWLRRYLCSCVKYVGLRAGVHSTRRTLYTWTRWYWCAAYGCVCRQDAHEGQVPDRVQRVPEGGAGEGVPVQQVHHDPAQGGAGARHRAVGAPGEDLVPEPAGEGEEAEEEARGVSDAGRGRRGGRHQDGTDAAGAHQGRGAARRPPHVYASRRAAGRLHVGTGCGVRHAACGVQSASPRRSYCRPHRLATIGDMHLIWVFVYSR